MSIHQIFVAACFALFLVVPATVSASTKSIVVEPTAEASDKRVALVIGNAAYGLKSDSGVKVPNLVNPLNDAQAIRDTLKKLGFRVVYGENLTKKELERAIGTFATLVESADVAITYFSGHGSTFGDTPYIVPVDAEFDSLESIPYELVRVEDFIGELRRAKGVRIALIDACRDNAAAEALKSMSKTKGVGQSKGLARVSNPDGLIIVYATQFLTTAEDGDSANSPFAAALVQHLPTPGEDVTNVLRDVARDVVARTGGRQRPEVSISLFDEFVLNPGTLGASPVASPTADTTFAEAQAAYEAAVRIGSKAAYQSIIDSFPNTVQAKLAAAAAEQRLAVVTPPSETPAPARPSCDGLVASVGDAGVAAVQDRCLKPKDVFRDCQNCPEMVMLPAGRFTMGSPKNEDGRGSDEGPQHDLTIAKPFAVGRFEVTVREYAAFVKASRHDSGGSCWVWNRSQAKEQKGMSWRDPGYAQTDDHPVACVSFKDAKAYVSWLAKESGRDYRLLSEAEWEYAARGETAPGAYPRFYFGNEEGGLCDFANGADKSTTFEWRNKSCSDGVGNAAAAAGRYRPNAFGLHDMLGNLWEWVEDCYHDSYAGAPTDGSGLMSGNCESRSIRGGAWNFGPKVLRAANRDWNPADERSSDVGFRVARTL